MKTLKEKHMNTTNTLNNNTIENEEVVSVITRKEFCILWKKVSNDKRAKPHLVEYKTYGGQTYKVKEKGWIYPEHHIIYNLIRGLPVTRGFKEDSDGFKNALSSLKNFYHLHSFSHLHKPFEEVISLENFKILLLEIKEILKA